MKTEILCSDLKKDYKKSIGFPEDYTYLKGKPIKVHVPVETALNKVMIVGAYPSARFFTVQGPKGKVTNTPMEDHNSPFSNETYFDGSRVRTIPSGQELNEVILQKIGVKREDCWITDLVKVFLFKLGHIERYKTLGKTDMKPNRQMFNEYARASLPWLHREIDICNPYVIILLGQEVAKAFFGVSNAIALKYLDGAIRQKEINGIERNIICLPHPGILMKKKMTKNLWPERFKNEIAEVAKREIERINPIID